MAEFSADARSDIEELLRDMRELEDVTAAVAKEFKTTEAEAKRVARALQAQGKAAAKAADAEKTAADKAASSSVRAKKGVDGLRKAAEAAQGPVGGVTSRLLSAGEAALSFVAAAGPAAPVLLAIGAAALGGAGAVAGMVALANAGSEAAKRLEEARRQGALLNDTLHAGSGSLDDYDNSTTNLSMAMDELKVTLGENVAPTLSFLTTLVAASVSEVNRAITAALEWTSAQRTLRTGINATLTVLRETVESATGLQGYADAMDRAREAGEAFEQSQQEIAKAEKKATEIAREKTAERRRQVAALRSAQSASDALAASLKAQAESDFLGTLKGEERLLAQNAQRLAELAATEARLLELRAQGADVSEALRELAAARLGEELAHEQALAEFRDAEQQRAAERYVERSRFASEIHDQVTQHMADEEKRAKDALDKQRNAQVGFVQSLAQNAQAAAESLGAMFKEGSKQAKQAAAISKGIALADIGYNTAVAITKAIALFGPPPSPVGIAGIALAGTIGAAQAASVIASQPTFHTGGEVDATLMAGEYVVNRDAAQRNKPALEAMNSGQQVGSAPAVAIVQWNGRTLDRGLFETARADGQFRRLFQTNNRLGMTSPYGS